MLASSSPTMRTGCVFFLETGFPETCVDAVNYSVTIAEANSVFLTFLREAISPNLIPSIFNQFIQINVKSSHYF